MVRFVKILNSVLFIQFFFMKVSFSYALPISIGPKSPLKGCESVFDPSTNSKDPVSTGEFENREVKALDSSNRLPFEPDTIQVADSNRLPFEPDTVQAADSNRLPFEPDTIQAADSKPHLTKSKPTLWKRLRKKSFNRKKINYMIAQYKKSKPPAQNVEDFIRTYNGDIPLSTREKKLAYDLFHKLGTYFTTGGRKGESDVKLANEYFIQALKFAREMDQPDRVSYVSYVSYQIGKNILIDRLRTIHNQETVQQKQKIKNDTMEDWETWIHDNVTHPIDRAKIEVLLLLFKNHEVTPLDLFEKITYVAAKAQTLEEKYAIFYTYRNALLRDKTVESSLNPESAEGQIIMRLNAMLRDIETKIPKSNDNYRIPNMKSKNNTSKAFFFLLVYQSKNILDSLKSAYAYIKRVQPKDLDSKGIKIGERIYEHVRNNIKNSKARQEFQKNEDPVDIISIFNEGPNESILSPHFSFENNEIGPASKPQTRLPFENNDTIESASLESSSLRRDGRLDRNSIAKDGEFFQSIIKIEKKNLIGRTVFIIHKKDGEKYLGKFGSPKPDENTNLFQSLSLEARSNDLLADIIRDSELEQIIAVPKSFYVSDIGEFSSDFSKIEGTGKFLNIYRNHALNGDKFIIFDHIEGQDLNKYVSVETTNEDLPQEIREKLPSVVILSSLTDLLINNFDHITNTAFNNIMISRDNKIFLIDNYVDMGLEIPNSKREQDLKVYDEALLKTFSNEMDVLKIDKTEHPVFKTIQLLTESLTKNEETKEAFLKKYINFLSIKNLRPKLLLGKDMNVDEISSQIASFLTVYSRSYDKIVNFFPEDDTGKQIKERYVLLYDQVQKYLKGNEEKLNEHIKHEIPKSSSENSIFNL